MLAVRGELGEKPVSVGDDHVNSPKNKAKPADSHLSIGGGKLRERICFPDPLRAIRMDASRGLQEAAARRLATIFESCA